MSAPLIRIRVDPPRGGLEAEYRPPPPPRVLEVEYAREAVEEIQGHLFRYMAQDGRGPDAFALSCSLRMYASLACAHVIYTARPHLEMALRPYAESPTFHGVPLYLDPLPLDPVRSTACRILFRGEALAALVRSLTGSAP